MKQTMIALTLIAATLIVGCESETPRVDANLGKSVAHMIDAQTNNPAAARAPAALASVGADGQRLENALDAHRKDVPKGQEQVLRPMTFLVGGAQH